MLNQEGNLLDSEGGVGSLGADWSISVPVGISSHLGATAELAEIFGTSDDEDESFSFNLNTGLSLAKDLGLDEEAKKFDSSPILNVAESQLFLNSMQDAISIDPKDNISIGAGKGAEGDKIELGEELFGSSPQTGEGNSGTSAGESGDGPDAPKRKSIRIRKRMEDVAAKVQDFSRDRRPRVESTEEGVKAYRSARTSGEGKLDEVEGQGTAGDQVEATSQEREEGSMEEGSDGDESDDPDKLWCVCRQPHGDRFMICCDCCGEWYHGDCIGISVSQGKRMERAGEDYVCVSCQERERKRKEQKEADRIMRLAKREQAKEKDTKNVFVKSEDHTPSPNHPSRSGSTPSHTHHISSTSSEDQYGTTELFKPDNAPKGGPEQLGADGGGGVQGESGNTAVQKQITDSQLKEVSEPKPPSSGSDHQKLKVKEENSCIGPDCSKVATPPSLYCSDHCIEKHAAKMLRLLAKRGVSIQTTPGEFVRGGGGVSVMERATGKVVMGLAAPSESKLVGWLKSHPSYLVLLPHGKGVKTRGGGGSQPKKEVAVSTHKPEKPPLDEGSIRGNAKKALFQTLWTRCEGASDLSVAEEKVSEIAGLIEDKLFDLHKDITPKYKMKYRSLLFNLKDTKNQALFRRVLLEEVTAETLVQMSPEELASEQLTHWREQAIKKDLEMIKIQEVEEAQTMVGTIRKMTYKGEVEIEVPEMVKTAPVDTTALVPQAEAKQKLEPAEPAPADDRSRSSVSDSKDLKSHSKALDLMPSILDILDNTTASHGSHVFDHRCDICMGKVAPLAPPPPPPPPPPPSSSAPSIPLTPPVLTETSAASTPDSSLQNAPEDNIQDITETKSPDPDMEPIWRGSIMMHMLPTFTACAYEVSGPVDGLGDVLPETFQVMGRIAHVQVWDYLEKLQKSSTRDITVLRMDWTEGEYEAYTEMLQYLVSKHRCGVVQSGFAGIKDFYLVPLMKADDIPHQLLPLRGPGLSRQRSDMLLAVMVRSRAKLPPSSHTTRESRPAPASHKRHHGDSADGSVRSKKVRFHMDAGASSTTTPTLREPSPVGILATRSNLNPSRAEPIPPVPLATTTALGAAATGLASAVHVTPEEKMDTSEGPSPLTSGGGTVQMSFYGHPLSPPAQQGGGPQVTAPPTASELVPIISSCDVSSILSQLSDEKIKELASAVSALSSTGVGPQTPLVPAAPVQDTPTSLTPPSVAISTSAPNSAALQLVPTTDVIRPSHPQEGYGVYTTSHFDSTSVYPVAPPTTVFSVPPTSAYPTSAPSTVSGYPADVPPAASYPADATTPPVAMDYQPHGAAGYAHQTAPYPQDPSYQYPVHPSADPYAGPSAYHQGPPSAYYGADHGSYPDPSHPGYPGPYSSQYPDPRYGYDTKAEQHGYQADSPQQGPYYHNREYSDSQQGWNPTHRNYDDNGRGDSRDPRDYAPKGREQPREWKQRSGRYRYESGYDGSYDRR